jgi:DNA-binding transcriptional MocR family regulator
MPGELSLCEPDDRATHLRLSFSTLSLDDIEEAIKRLGHVVKSLM